MMYADRSRLYLAVAAFIAVCAGWYVHAMARQVGRELDGFAQYQVQLALPTHERVVGGGEL